jgi:hypothetical protein
MINIKTSTGFMLLAVLLFLAAGNLKEAKAQDQRWIRVGQLQCWFRDDGANPELSPDDFLTWPTQYGDDQTTSRMEAFWLGAQNFYDTVEGKTKSVKVVGSGPRYPENQQTITFPQSIKLIAKYPPPTVVVDEQIGTNNTLYDTPDELDEDLPCDRMVVVKYNTSIGVSVTRKVLAFTQQNHDSYFINDIVLTNTGIINAEGETYEQTLEEFWAYFFYRFAFAGVTSSGFGSTWGAFSSEWGASTLNYEFGTTADAELRGFYSWYGPNEERPISYGEDWGCPNHEEDGLIGSAKYAGATTLFASIGPDRFDVNDPLQPKTTAYVSSDDEVMNASVSQFDENFMGRRYMFMSEGHLPQTHVEEVGEGNYPETLATTNPLRNAGGGTSQGQGFGPYTLEPGDSIRIVFAEGVNGLGWPLCRKVGAVWYSYYTSTGTPDLVMPDGSLGSDHNAYKRAWCETGADSILQVYRSAKANFESNYTLPSAPPAPSEFTVTSGGDRIRLTWADNATSDPHFDGYVIYRSEGNVKDYRTKYEKIFECDASNVVHEFDDVLASRGFNYYYYIQSKDDGSQNEVHPGTPLYSSLFLTLTATEAYLRRPAGLLIDQVRVVPNPYDIRARMWQFGEDAQFDRLAFYELPPLCKLKIFTERGDLIWEKDHTDGSGDELWDSQTTSRQIVVSGIYILYVEVTEDAFAQQDIIAPRDYVDPKSGEIIHHEGDMLFRESEQMYSKGESVMRKFVIIR